MIQTVELDTIFLKWIGFLIIFYPSGSQKSEGIDIGSIQEKYKNSLR